MIGWRARWKAQWSPTVSFDGKCNCDQDHMALLVKDRRMCPCLYWARTCTLILERRGLEEMNKWIENNPMDKFIRRIGEMQNES